MSQLDRSPQIAQLANDLGLPCNQDPVQVLIEYCIQKIRPWLTKPVRNVGELEAIVCARLSLKVHEVWSDEELIELIQKYVATGDFIFANLQNSLNNWTFAELIRRKRTSDEVPELYVAVIDCRGFEKSSRRFFTKWHEIAHLLTLTPQMTFPFNRSSDDKCPIESLMDAIAAEIGFYRPLFNPILESHMATNRNLTLDGIRAIGEQFCPEASFHSTAIACVKRVEQPAILVEARMSLKKNEKAVISSPQLMFFPVEKPKEKLRAVNITLNKEARDYGVRIDRNMEVPPHSIISKAYNNDFSGLVQCGRENLDSWIHSNGTPLPSADVYVEAQAFNDSVLALITLRI